MEIQSSRVSLVKRRYDQEPNSQGRSTGPHGRQHRRRRRRRRSFHRLSGDWSRSNLVRFGFGLRLVGWLVGFVLFCFVLYSARLSLSAPIRRRRGTPAANGNSRALQRKPLQPDAMIGP